LTELSTSGNICFVDIWDISEDFVLLKYQEQINDSLPKENASSSPILFSTTDFKSFKLISDVHPEREYNWLTITIVNFKTINGRLNREYYIIRRILTA
jgi:hypothetical protein